MGRRQYNTMCGKKQRCRRFQQCVREYQREKGVERIIIVAVHCMSCGEIVPTNSLIKQFCEHCRRMLYQDVPRWVIHDLVNQPSFKRYPKTLLKWKRVIDFKQYKRDNNIRKMSMENRLRR